jgi:hypothetical protein
VELLSLVTDRKSSFTLDITVNKFDGGQYAPGEQYEVSCTSERAAYLYLLYLDSQGELAVLFPPPGVDNRIPAQHRLRLPAPDAPVVFRTFDSPGTHRIKAVATSMPLVFSGLLPGGETPGRATGVGEFRLPPSHRSMFEDILGRYQRAEPIDAEELGSVSPHEFLGEFGQDEVAFYVGPPSSGEERPGR